MYRKQTALFALFVALSVAVGCALLPLGVSAQSEPTPDPTVKAAVEQTLTALAPSPTATQSASPTRTPTATPTASPSRTPTATTTPSPTASATQTLSVEEQIERTLTQYYIDQMTLQVWVEWESGATHPWHRQLPDEIRASSRSEAELVVTIEQQRVFVRSQDYTHQFTRTFACTVKGYRIDYDATLTNAQTGELLARREFRGAEPSFPHLISSCEDQVGLRPDPHDGFINWVANYTYLLGTPTPTPTSTRIPSQTPMLTPTGDPNYVPHWRSVTAGSAILRDCPQQSCRTIAILKQGDSFLATGEFTSELGTTWYSLTHEGETVWVYGKGTGPEGETE